MGRQIIAQENREVDVEADEGGLIRNSWRKFNIASVADDDRRVDSLGSCQYLPGRGDRDSDRRGVQEAEELLHFDVAGGDPISLGVRVALAGGVGIGAERWAQSASHAGMMLAMLDACRRVCAASRLTETTREGK